MEGNCSVLEIYTKQQANEHKQGSRRCSDSTYREKMLEKLLVTSVLFTYIIVVA